MASSHGYIVQKYDHVSFEMSSQSNVLFKLYMDNLRTGRESVFNWQIENSLGRKFQHKLTANWNAENELLLTPIFSCKSTLDVSGQQLGAALVVDPTETSVRSNLDFYVNQRRSFSSVCNVFSRRNQA
jgi:hypothetical protein